MYVCIVCVNIYVYVRMYTCVYDVCIYVCVCMHVLYMRVHMYVRKNMYVYSYMCMFYKNLRRHSLNFLSNVSKLLPVPSIIKYKD